MGELLNYLHFNFPSHALEKSKHNLRFFIILKKFYMKYELQNLPFDKNFLFT